MPAAGLLPEFQEKMDMRFKDGKLPLGAWGWPMGYHPALGNPGQDRCF